MKPFMFLLLLCGLLTSALQAGDVCLPVVQKQVVTQYHAQAVQAVQVPQYTYGYVYTQVAPQIADYAANTQALHAHPLYREYLRDKGDYLAYLEWKATQAQKEELKTKATVISQKCGQCHGEQLDEPKGGFRLLESGNTDKSVTKSLKKVRDGTMPPKSNLTPDEKGSLMGELLNSLEQEE